MVLNFILVFLAVAVVDAIWAHYFLASTNKEAHKAGFYSAMIIAVGAFSTRSYVHDGMLVIPAALGAYVGTALTIFYNKRKETNASE